MSINDDKSNQTSKRSQNQNRSSVPKSKFLSECSINSGIDLDVLTRSYDAITGEIINQINNGRDIKLAGFGRFWLQEHKRHNNNFGPKGINDVPDYYVALKYSPSAIVKKKISEANVIK